jgi:hypothetical protein
VYTSLRFLLREGKVDLKLIKMTELILAVTELIEHMKNGQSFL